MNRVFQGFVQTNSLSREVLINEDRSARILKPEGS